MGTLPRETARATVHADPLIGLRGCNGGLTYWGAGNGVDVDHVRSLSLGGEDVDSNVQVLCHGCHGLKVATEFGVQTPPF